MHNYDFEILQYNEFENLTRDLLQKQFGIFIESFKNGRDGGVDLRFGIANDAKCVVQVKRYKDYKTLLPVLKKELEKVKKLNPERYILSTSVELSPDYKDEIMEIFRPYIKTTEDILGRKDLNNLLDLHPEIERQYYKLWLASTEVLEEILHKDVRNWSRFELDTIREEIKTYVMNDSYQKALNILNEYGYVIISGIPGIGKTTLARILIYNLLARGYEEFVCIEDDLRDGARLFQQGKKQVFFFDDFLGSNIFEVGEKDFENKLISFVKAIKREGKNKLFIMTTREYILTQAKAYYEKFDLNRIDIAKCTLDMGAYSRTIKAKIVYNHLADARLDDDYIEQLLREQNYNKIIEHKNFNPRVVEAFIDSGRWKGVPVEKFAQAFVQMFDKPITVWEYAFESLPVNARYALLVLSTMGKDVFEKDWRIAFESLLTTYREKLAITNSDAKWGKIIRLLEDCFIRTKMTDKGLMVVSLYNPSVLGFMVEYIRNNYDVQKQLIGSAEYAEQLYTIFTNQESLSKAGDGYVLLSTELTDIVHEKLPLILSKEQPTCELEIFSHRKHAPYSKMRTLHEYSRHYDNDGVLENYISKEDLIDSKTFLYLRLPFLEQLDWRKVDFTCDEVIESIMREQLDLEDFVDFIDTLYAVGRKSLTTRKVFLDKLNDTIDDQICEHYFDYASLESTREYVLQLADRYKNNEDIFASTVYLSRIQEAENDSIPDSEDSDEYKEQMAIKEADDREIEEMMTSLRVKE